MALWKRGKQYWLDAVVHGQRYREPLGTSDWREAKRLERERLEQLEGRASVPTANSRTYAAMDVATAIETYAEERRAQVSKRMAAYWLENAKPLATFFNETRLRQICGVPKCSDGPGSRAENDQWRTVGAPAGTETGAALVPVRRRLRHAAQPETSRRHGVDI
jgi:hypothetical protein